jgi:hypothetical protein
MAAQLSCSADEDTREDTVLLATPAHLNVNKVSRHLRRADLSLRNCLHSVSADADWVDAVAARFTGRPVVANLRCGLWYTRRADATAYFKVRESSYLAAGWATLAGVLLSEGCEEPRV